MADPSALDLIHGLWEYHWWANRRLFDVAAGLGEEAARREVGPQFSYPTVLRMFAHIYGADWLWLQRWRGTSAAALPGGEIGDLATLRARWDALEPEQRAFLSGLAPADLGRTVPYRNTQGQAFHAPLVTLLQHVPNHATHHRSEIATMLTMISGSPPDTGLVLHALIRTGQVAR